jgi:hypothetical protein
MAGDELDARVDALYGLPLDRFVAERDALAARLRREGRRAEAARVAALAKPSVAAWAVNQVVRTQPTLAAALWRAGDAVLAAQARVVAGEGSGAELRAAVEAQRAALAPLAEAARGLVTGAGRFLADPHVQALVETLHAAAVDPAQRPPVAAGRLTRPLQLAGLGAALGAGGPAASPPAAGGGRAGPRSETDAPAGDRGAAGAEPDARRRDSRRAEARAAQGATADPRAQAASRRAAAERRARRQAARRALARAERARDDARARLTDAEQRREAAAAEAARARRALEAAETALADAEATLAAARAELRRADGAVDAARAQLDAGT